jgi:2-keto-4-pentenoate hydratase/2-oxohepta-3-ene-1,7-dioic acid hydratase in catechol pathway
LKLARFDAGRGPRPALVRVDGIVDLQEQPGGFESIAAIVAGGDAALERVRQFDVAALVTYQIADVQLLAPIERVGKYLAIGMNYRKHLAEAERIGVPAPKRQLWFNKQTSCISGPYDPIDPGVTEKLDYEVELGLVIGKPAKYATEETAREHIFGYFVANDVSARDWQFHSPTFTLGKSFDSHGPIGPWIVTADEIADPHALDLRCYVNGEIRQSSNTCEMIHNIYQQVAYLSTAFTLESGDLIATGTPEGVGVGMTPPAFLRPGDRVRCEIDNIGVIENRVWLQPLPL